MRTSEEELFYWEPNESKYRYCYQTSDIYNMGGVLFDIGAPIYISDLRYDIGGVLYDTRPPVYYIRCAIY